MLKLTLIAFFIVLAIAAFLYLRPRFINEGFATIALDEESMPKCFLRDTEAQSLLADLRATVHDVDSNVSYNEFKLIVQKLLCIDADVTGSGAGVYSTYQLPYATAHDIEPAANFVNRCIRNAVRETDVEMVIDKFQTRGNELLGMLCAKGLEGARAKFHNVVGRAAQGIKRNCLMQKAVMDVPAGPRDPGYFVPADVDALRPYTISGGDKQYI
jgi:hypothetical protein